jgi:hypothetical protein
VLIYCLLALSVEQDQLGHRRLKPRFHRQHFRVSFLKWPKKERDKGHQSVKAQGEVQIPCAPFPRLNVLYIPFSEMTPL